MSSSSSSRFQRGTHLRHIHVSAWQNFLFFSDMSSTAGRSIPGGVTFAQVATLAGHAGAPAKLLVTPDNSTVIASTAWSDGSSIDRDQIFVWDLNSNKPLGPRVRPSAMVESALVENEKEKESSSSSSPHTRGIKAHSATLSPCGRYVAALTAVGDPHIVVFDISRSARSQTAWHAALKRVALVRLLRVNGPASALAWSSCGGFFFVGGENATLISVAVQKDEDGLIASYVDEEWPSTRLHLSLQHPLSTATIDSIDLLPNGKFAVITLFQSSSSSSSTSRSIRTAATFQRYLYCFSSPESMQDLGTMPAFSSGSEHQRHSDCTAQFSVSADGSTFSTGGRLFSTLFGINLRPVDKSVPVAKTRQIFISSADDDDNSFMDHFPGETEDEAYHRALTASPSNLLLTSSGDGTKIYDTTNNSTAGQRYAASSSGQARSDDDERLVSEVSPLSNEMMHASRDGQILVTSGLYSPIALWVRVRGAPVATVSTAGLCEGGGAVTGLRVSEESGVGKEAQIEVQFENGAVERIMLPQAVAAKL